MNKKFVKRIALVLVIISIVSAFSSCNGKEKKEKIVDIIQSATEVLINGKKADSVEARMGAFNGKQGDFIEFKFPKPVSFNTIYIIEKTTSVRQFNIFAEIDGKYKLVYTGKNILLEDIKIETVTATAFKLQIVNTEIGNDAFTIQGISAYDLKESEN